MTINNLPKKCAACGSEVDIMRIIKKGRGDNPSCDLCERGLHTMVYKTEQEAIDARTNTFFLSSSDSNLESYYYSTAGITTYVFLLMNL